MENPLHRDHGPLVVWDRIDRDAFERLVEALIPLQHPDADVRIINGRGGDGGRDAIVREVDGRTIIYQLKFFPDGFDGKHRERRRQISNPAKSPSQWGSLERALEHQPDEWILVAPCNPTVSGCAWIEELKRTYANRVKITFVGRAQLDGPKWCAGHQDVVRSQMTRDEMLAKMQIANRERDVLAGPNDLSERLQALGSVVDDIDPAWTWDFARMGDTTIQTLRPKHSAAGQTNPIHLKAMVHCDDDDPHLAAFRQAVDFGSFTAVALPGEFVSELEITGSPLVEREELNRTLERIELHPATGIPPTPIALALRDEGNAQFATTISRDNRMSHGSRGMTLEQKLHGALTLTWRLPTDMAEVVSIGIEFDSNKAVDAGELLKAIQLTRKLSQAAAIELQIDGKPFMRGQFTEPSQLGIARHADDNPEWEEVVEDLAHVQEATSTYFPIPETFATMDRIWLRVLRLALQGRMSFCPERKRLTTSFQPSDAEHAGVARLLAGEKVLLMSTMEIELPLEEHSIRLPELTFVMRRGILQDADTVGAGLAAGRRMPAVITSHDDEPLVVFIRSRVPEDIEICPEPWGLTGVKEATALR
ncbi:hypothetical protein [Granulicoccus phenolivorans]|uniref:hypothetical protein n=1 Tax=Granulicoccus phenolivorans TaxID=266854 RepID=UPI0011AEB7CE|nr:hypothetical protein [Granulicoccus phenolivorans]